MATSLIVHLEIAAEQFKEFLKIVRTHGEFSENTEPGCLSFQIMVPKEEQNKVILVEVYQDDASLEAHWNSDHMAKYREKVEDMIVDRKRYLCTT
jgi:quinol monooxygenase YgiN